MELIGYNLFREDRKGGLRGGGVLLYVKSELRSVSFNANSTGEYVCCRILGENNNDLVVGVVYRSDNHGLNMDANESVRHLIRELQPQILLLMGDFNYPDIDWENNDGVGSNSRMFVECLENGFLTQHIKKPRRGQAC